MPNAVPSTKTPAVNDGDVQTISKVGDIIVIGGNFTSVAGQPRSYVAAFNQNTGVLQPNFHPVLNGPVLSSTPGPTADTVFVGGTFTTVDGVAVQRIALLNVNTGARITTFKAADPLRPDQRPGSERQPPLPRRHVRQDRWGRPRGTGLARRDDGQA